LLKAEPLIIANALAQNAVGLEVTSRAGTAKRKAFAEAKALV
jgi:hypothetical protein